MPGSSQIASSGTPAETSFTMEAPASRASRATCALLVSIEIVASPASPETTGRTRSSSTPRGTGSAPGRVDSPPTSRMSAPSPASARPCSTAASASRNSPPSENESGVTLTIPMRTGWRTSRILPSSAIAATKFAMTLYELLLFVHIAATIVWIGAGLFGLVLVLGYDKDSDEAALLRFSKDQERLAPRLFIPSSLVVVLVGI